VPLIVPVLVTEVRADVNVPLPEIIPELERVPELDRVPELVSVTPELIVRVWPGFIVRVIPDGTAVVKFSL